jgi:hypothetical protein
VETHPGPFVVIGMGRSGTSFVASILHESGISMGERLKPPDQQNEAGYFEDLEITEMHAGWLMKFGFDFGSVSGRFPLEPTAAMTDAVRSLVAQREARGRPWGLKPPGALQFWPAWEAALPRSTVLVLAFRHPRGVSASYEAAGASREWAEGLWLQLNRIALKAIERSPFAHVVIDFDRPHGGVLRLAGVLGRPVVDTYREELHHHRVGGALTGELGIVYRELRRRARMQAG